MEHLPHRRRSRHRRLAAGHGRKPSPPRHTDRKPGGCGPDDCPEREMGARSPRDRGGLILMLGALVALSRSIEGGVPGALAWLGSIAAVAGVTVGVVLVIVDGVAAKHLADAWEVAPPEEAAAALRMVVAEEAINFALAALFNILFAGVTFILLGLAVALSGEYPGWLGWVVVVAGFGSVAVGLVQAYTGESIGFTRIATIIFPTIITLWVVGMSVLLLRKAGLRTEGPSRVR